MHQQKTQQRVTFLNPAKYRSLSPRSFNISQTRPYNNIYIDSKCKINLTNHLDMLVVFQTIEIKRLRNVCQQLQEKHKCQHCKYKEKYHHIDIDEATKTKLELQRTRDQLEQLKNKYQQCKRANQKLKESNIIIEAQNASLTANLEKHRKKIQSLENQSMELKHNVEQHCKQLAKRNEAIKKLQEREYHSRYSPNTKIQREYQRLQIKLHKKKRQIEKYKEKNQELQSDYKKLQRKYDQLNEQCRFKLKKLGDHGVHSGVGQLKKQITQYKDKVQQELNFMKQKNKDKIKSQETIIKQLQVKIQKLEQTNENLKKHLKQIQKLDPYEAKHHPHIIKRQRNFNKSQEHHKQSFKKSNSKEKDLFPNLRLDRVPAKNYDKHLHIDQDDFVHSVRRSKEEFY